MIRFTVLIFITLFKRKTIKHVKYIYGNKERTIPSINKGLSVSSDFIFSVSDFSDSVTSGTTGTTLSFYSLLLFYLQQDIRVLGYSTD